MQAQFITLLSKCSGWMRTQSYRERLPSAQPLDVLKEAKPSPNYLASEGRFSQIIGTALGKRKPELTDFFTADLITEAPFSNAREHAAIIRAFNREIHGADLVAPTTATATKFIVFPTGLSRSYAAKRHIGVIQLWCSDQSDQPAGTYIPLALLRTLAAAESPAAIHTDPGKGIALLLEPLNEPGNLQLKVNTAREKDVIKDMSESLEEFDPGSTSSFFFLVSVARVFPNTLA